MIIITTKEITIRKFLLPIIISLIKNNINIIIITKNAKLLEMCFTNDQKNYLKFINFNFPTSIIEVINPYNFIKIIFKLRKLIKNSQNKNIYLHTPMASHFVRLSTFFLRTNIIYHVHGFRFHEFGNKLKNLFFFIIEFILQHKVNFYVVLNEYDELVVKKYFKTECIRINGIGIDSNYINKYSYINNYNNKKTFKIIVIGAYKIEKGYFDIINLLKNNTNKIFIDCFGYGNPNKFKNIAKKNNIQNINFNDFDENIIKKMCNYHCLIISSKREGLSVTLMEALTLGIPIITTNARGCKDLIIDNFNGILYDLKNPNELIKKVDILINNYDDFYIKAKKYKIECYNKFDNEKIIPVLTQYLIHKVQ